MTRTRTRIDFEHFVKNSTLEEFYAAGFMDWKLDDKKSTILLIPKEMCNDIPEGFNLILITGVAVKFQPGITSDDHRGGALAYGIDKKIIDRDSKIKKILN